MRQNFTQKFLTIFVLLSSVFAFQYQVNAQACTDTGGDIGNGAVGNNSTSVCPGSNPSLVGDMGSGTSGGPVVTYQWQFRNASTGGTFQNVPNNNTTAPVEPDSAGTGQNYQVVNITQTTDYVRIRYSGTSSFPQSCQSFSDIISVTAVDNQAPSIDNCGSLSQTLSAGTDTCGRRLIFTGTSRNVNAPFLATATDNCTSSSSITFRYFVGTRNSPVLIGSTGFVFPVGNTTVRVVAQDATGNVGKTTADTCVFTITVTDNQAPSLTINNPSDTAQTNVSQSPTPPPNCQATVTFAVTTSDNCGTPTLTYVVSGATSASGNGVFTGNLNLGRNIIDYTATDANGNSTTRRDSIFVVDRTGPTFNNARTTRTYTIGGPGQNPPPAPGNTNSTSTPVAGCFRKISSLPQNSTNPGGTYTIGGETRGGTLAYQTVGQSSGLSDNCSGISTITNITNSPGGPDTLVLGTNTITFTATDQAGNTSTTTQTVILRDTIAPLIASQGNRTIRSSATSCDTTVSGLTASVTDNCSGVGTVSFTTTFNGVTTSGTGSDASGTRFRRGITTVTYTATDGSGNTGSTSFTITVLDSSGPIVRTRNVSVRLASNNTATMTADTLNNGTTDCSGGVRFAVARINNISDTLNNPNGSGRRLAFTCTETASPIIVFLFSIDSAGNFNSAPATVTVNSSMTVSAVGTSTSCTNAADNSINTTASGSGAKTFMISGTNLPGGYTATNSTGQFNNLPAGKYVVRVNNDATPTCFTTSDSVTLSPGVAGSTGVDQALSTADVSSSNFFTPTSSNTLVLGVSEVGGFTAASTVIRIVKPAGYTFTFNQSQTSATATSTYTVQNSRFTFADNGTIVTLTLNGGGVTCQETVRVALTMTRNTTNVGTFSLTPSVQITSGENNSTNNSQSIQFVVE